MYGLSDDDASLLLVNIDWEKGVCPSESQFSKDSLISIPISKKQSFKQGAANKPLEPYFF